MLFKTRETAGKASRLLMLGALLTASVSACGDDPKRDPAEAPEPDAGETDGEDPNGEDRDTDEPDPSTPEDDASTPEDDADVPEPACGRDSEPCVIGQACQEHADCVGGLVCHGTHKLCLAPSCDDGVKNGSETDMDCGGSCAGKCDAEQACSADNDCAESAPFCDSVAQVCSEVSCGPGQYDAGEGCVDVGVGYWSPDKSRERIACEAKPANTVFSGETASSAQCPWSCAEGYLRSANGEQCIDDFNCAEGEVVVGIHGFSGAWLDAIGVRCAPFEEGEIAGRAYYAPAVGGPGGDPFFLDCGEDEVVHGITGLNGWALAHPNAEWCSDTSLAKIQVSCRSLTTDDVRVVGTAGGEHQLCTAPVEPEFEVHCSTGENVQGLVLKPEYTYPSAGHLLSLLCH